MNLLKETCGKIFTHQKASPFGVIPRTVIAVAGIFIVSVSNLRADTEQTQVIGPFGTLNTADSPAIIASNQAQDLLNVDITPTGKSVKKRMGYGLDAALTVSTGPVHGGYHFFDSSGNDIRLWAHDAHIASSVNGASYVDISTITVGATLDCTDFLGFAYCVDSSRDMPIKTAGTVATTSFQNTIPAGTCVASTPERLLVANTAANPSRIYYSGASNFTDFTLGAFTSSSSFEDISAPGSHITHVAYRYGRWMWWKDQSFGFIAGTDQTNLQIITVSNYVGTFDNTDVYDQGITYFRANDNHFYTYDGANYQRISRDIAPTVESANRRKSNLWTQTTKTDFQSGLIVPTGSLTTLISAGDVRPSSFTATDTTSADFDGGTYFHTTSVSGSVKLTLDNLGNVTNNGMESVDSGVILSQWGTTAFQRSNDGPAGSTCRSNITGITGSFFAESFNGQRASLSPRLLVSFIDSVSSATLDTQSYSLFALNCKFSTQTFTVSSSNIGKSARLRFVQTDDDATTNDDTLVTSSTYLIGGNLTFEMAVDDTNGGSTLRFAYIDNIVNGVSSVSSGTYTSKVFDTGITSTVVTGLANWTVSESTPSFEVQTATASTGAWVRVEVSSGINANANRYVRYLSSITSGQLDNGFTTLDDVTVVAQSSGGIFLSAVNNAPSLTNWGTFGVTDNAVGASSITYYTRAAGLVFSVNSSTPAWTPQPKNGTIATSTGTFMQTRADFNVTLASIPLHLDDFTMNWFEGTASDKMYGSYFSYAIWFSVSLGTTTSNNNRILRYDLLNQGWMVYDIGANGFITQNNSLYIGSASNSNVYIFGNSTSDNGSAINAYWKSKDFFGASPFIDDEIRSLSWYAKSSSGTINISYQINLSTTTTYSMNLFDSTSNIIRSNRYLPFATVGNVFNVKFGDVSTNSPWEMYAGQMVYIQKPWDVHIPQ